MENEDKEPKLSELWEETKSNIGMGIFWAIAILFVVALIVLTIVFRIHVE